MTHPLAITADGAPTLLLDNPEFLLCAADHLDRDSFGDTWRALRAVSGSLLCYGERGDGSCFINISHNGVRWIVSGSRAEFGRIRAAAAALADWLTAAVEVSHAG